MRSAIAFILLNFAPAVLGCTVPPVGLFREHSTLLNEATSVVLVEVISSRNSPSSCEFNVLRSWKARAPGKLPVICRAPGAGDWMTDFASHTERQFWQQHSGRLGINGDCSLISPAFAIGQKYLIFLGIAPDVKQFEQVSMPNDRWLQYVEQHLPPSPQP